MEGDQACWKRLVGMTKCINLDTIDRTQDLILKKIKNKNICIQIKRAQKLRRLTLQNIRMTDADMTDILSANPLASLEELNISANGTINLTEDTVFRLLEQCPRLVVFVQCALCCVISEICTHSLRTTARLTTKLGAVLSQSKV